MCSSMAGASIAGGGASARASKQASKHASKRLDMGMHAHKHVTHHACYLYPYACARTHTYTHTHTLPPLLLPRSAQRVQKAVADVTAAQRASAGGVSTTAAAAAAAATMPLVPLPQGYVADLSSLAEIADFAASVRHDHGRLTGLINNAGVYEPSRRCVRSKQRISSRGV
jgi:hypothetical protein